jgi:hypothetical protein
VVYFEDNIAGSIIARLEQSEKLKQRKFLFI